MKLLSLVWAEEIEMYAGKMEMNNNKTRCRGFSWGGENKIDGVANFLTGKEHFQQTAPLQEAKGNQTRTLDSASIKQYAK